MCPRCGWSYSVQERKILGRVGLYVRGGGLQSGADEESAGESSWNGVRQGRSVPARWKTGKTVLAAHTD